MTFHEEHPLYNNNNKYIYTPGISLHLYYFLKKILAAN